MNAQAPFPSPEINATNVTYWDSLSKGILVYQRCKGCDHAWLPARTECPCCLGPNYDWRPASGRAKLISWVVYHRAFNPAFGDRLPYNVAVVELEEGPRLISNILGLDPEQETSDQLTIDQDLFLTIRRENNVAIPAFVRTNP